MDLECQRPVCPGTGSTTISGTVFDPAGKVPLYNVIVYINNEPVTPFTDGVTCDRCTDTLSGKPIATALTDTNGRFVLENVPVGQQHPAGHPSASGAGRWSSPPSPPASTTRWPTP